MRQTVKLPRVADTVDEVVVVEWLVEVGDTVTAGDALVNVETDKAVVQIPSPVGGVLREQLVAVDNEIKTGAAVAVVET